MDFNIQTEEIQMEELIRNKMIREYLYIILAVAFLYFLSPIIFDLFLGDADGIDGIGSTMELHLL